MTPADLRTARKALGLTQKGLAERLQMGTHAWQTISKWESDSNERGVPGPVAVAVGYMLREAEATVRMVPVLEEPPNGLWPKLRERALKYRSPDESS